MTQICLRAHAKVNLALALAPPEPPGAERAGWHRICTWMHAIDLADEVLVEPLGAEARSTWSARWAADAPRPGLVDWPLSRDLAWRALRAIETRVGRRLPTRLSLLKRIPTGAGLGGGSSDAGAALVGIDRAWGLGLGLDTLREMGASLGSDVPFFIDHQNPPLPGVVGGFGELIERTGRASGSIILMVPPFGCPTGRVYRAFDALAAAGRLGPMRERRVHRLADAAAPVGASLFNDLAAPACAVAPDLAGLRSLAEAVLGRPVGITGSGSALFAPCEPGEAAGLAERARSRLRGVAVRACALV